MSLSVFLFFVAGLFLLILGAEMLVRGSSRIASFLGISPLIIGLTVVAFGTSSPELAVSVKSSLAGQADIAVGNVVGSNLFNILFILGLSAVITPLAASRQLIRLDVPVMIGVSALFFVFGLNGTISRAEGALLTAGFVLYTGFLVYLGRKENGQTDEFREEFSYKRGRSAARDWAVNLVIAVSGLALLVLGSRWLVDGAVQMARGLGISELIIGLTIISAGTSLPEVATSVMASIKGERDIAVGNIIGSNIFNILSVMGITSLVSAHGVAVPEGALLFDIPVMLAVSAACLPILFTGYTIARWEGALFLAYYVLYTAFIFLNATGHSSLPAFKFAMGAFVIPLTVVTIGVLTARALLARGKAARGES